jgi:hypothetical protein
MHLDVSLAEPAAVEPLRDLHRRETNCQIVLDSWLGRRWVDPYLLRLDGRVVGVGRVPAARCNAANAASRATLQKAGMMPCARVLTGVLAVG